MANLSTCITSLDLCAIRISKLTETGAPMTGAGNGYVADTPLSLGVTITTEAGDDLKQKNGCGALVAAYQSPDTIKGIDLALVLTDLDAVALKLLTGGSVYLDGTNAIGFQPPAVGAYPGPVCFEGWSKAWDTDTQLVDSTTTPNATWIHWVFPFTRWVQDNFSLAHQILTVPVKGKGSQNNHLTVNGPFNDWPAQVATGGGVTKLYGWFYDVAAPASTCQAIAVTSAAS